MFNLTKKIFQLLLNELVALKYFFVISYPNSRIGKLLRKKYWSSRLKSCGKNPDFHSNSTIGYPELIDIGNNFMMSDNSHMTAIGSKGIYIGDNVGIGRGSYLHASNQNFSRTDIPMNQQGIKFKEIKYNNDLYSIVIENDVLIGSNAVILSGSYIGQGTVISSGSVVSGNIPQYSVLVGNPARVSNNRKENDN